MNNPDFEQALSSIQQIPLTRVAGRLVRVTGILLEAVGCRMAIGQLCRIESNQVENNQFKNNQFKNNDIQNTDLENGGQHWIDAEVVGFDHDRNFLMPFKHPSGLAAGARVYPINQQNRLLIGDHWLGRVINGLGEPLDDKGKLPGNNRLPQELPQIHPLKRQPIRSPLDVGVRALNGLLTIGKGQRIGLMAGSGVGKSLLLGMITRYTQADVVVVGLIGERGREVQEFIEQVLQQQGLKKSVVIAAPADQSPLMRIRAATLSHRIASYYRDQGKDVLLLVDSLTRYAMAQREIALSLGEPPATKGYPASVFGMIPRLVESAGNSRGSGSMTAIYTVLAESDDQQDPIVDCARAVLDGHIVLSRDLAEAGHYPAIDISQSISRCMHQITAPEQQRAAQKLKQLYAEYQNIKPLIPLGGYVSGADPLADLAVRLAPAINRFLQQEIAIPVDFSQTLTELNLLMPAE